SDLIKDGKSIGTVSQVVCDLASGALKGLIVGVGAAEKGVLAEDLAVIGEDAVMIPSSDVVKHLSEMPELLKFRHDPSQGLLTVVTDDGTRLGYVSRIWVDPVARRVTRYEVTAGLLYTLTEGALLLPIVPGSVHGEDILIVPTEELLTLAAHTPGLRARLERLHGRVQQKTSAAREIAIKAAERAREQAAAAREAAEKAAAKAKEAAERLSKTVESVRERVGPTTQEQREGGEQAEQAEPKTPAGEAPVNEAPEAEAPAEESAQTQEGGCPQAHAQGEIEEAEVRPTEDQKPEMQ
ncbi:MAG: PRC-barrel domain-containing protein, partial [Armatimonadota bacterium]